MNIKSLLKQKITESTVLSKEQKKYIKRLYRRIRERYEECRLLLTNSQERSTALLRLMKPQQLHQPTSYTKMDRYPAVFQECSSYMNARGRQKLRILSFGCCTGEEVISLRRYFPQAIIVGAEINPASLKICRRREVDNQIFWVESEPEKIMEMGPYDIVFCMAVLEWKPEYVIRNGITNLSKYYPFEKFQSMVEILDSYVKKEGLLVIQYTPYNLMDTSVAEYYREHGITSYGCYLFDKNSRLINEKCRRENIFEKK